MATTRQRLSPSPDRRLDELDLIGLLIGGVEVAWPVGATIQVDPSVVPARLSAIHVARTFFDHKRNFVGQQWARGYSVSTVGRDEVVIREYIRNQEVEDERVDQL